MKKFMIMDGEFRNRLKYYEVITNIVAGLLT